MPVRCGRRDCRYCGWLRDLEDATVLFLDAREQQPELAITLTTAVPWEELDPAVYRDASRRVWRELRRRYGRVEYVGLIEFTTGRARRSGGRRRMHGHYLVKGIPASEVLAVEAVVRRVWERVTGAYVVEVSALRSAGGAIAYMGLHHRKPEQAAPAGWRGMRLRASEGYWHRPIADLRDQARRELAIRTRRWQLEQAGESPELAQLVAELDVDAQRQAVREHGAQLVHVREPTSPGGVVVPLGPVERASWRADAQPERAAVDLRPSEPLGGPVAPPESAPTAPAAPPDQIIRTRPGEPVKRSQSHSEPAADHPLDRAPAGATLTPRRRGRGSPERGSVRAGP